MKGVGMHIAQYQFSMSNEYKHKCVNKWNQRFKALSTDHDIICV